MNCLDNDSVWCSDLPELFSYILNATIINPDAFSGYMNIYIGKETLPYIQRPYPTRNCWKNISLDLTVFPSNKPIQSVYISIQ